MIPLIIFFQLEEHKQEVEAIMWDHHDKYREAKIELESLIQELQKELEKLKSTCIINTEKIGYNYQVRILSCIVGRYYTVNLKLCNFLT